jgi:hypothetical protein
MWFKGTWIKLEDIMLNEVNQDQKDNGHVFSHMLKKTPKDKHVHKNKHDHLQTHM